MKKALFTGALAAILIASSSLIAPTDCLAAPPKHPPRQSIKAPRPMKPPVMHRAEHRKPPTVNRAGENRRPPAVQRQENKRPPAVNRAGENRRPPAMRPMPSGRQDITKRPPNINKPPRGTSGVRPSGKPPTNSIDKRPHRPPANGFDKHPNNRPPHNVNRPPHGKPPHDINKPMPNRPPHDINKPMPNRPPHDRPPKYRPHHHRHYIYSGLYFPAIYGGYYYGVHYSDPTAIMYGITVCPADHPNIFLLNLMLTKNLYSKNDFAVFYSGQTALDYDEVHGAGAFYRLAIDNAPDIKKWKTKDSAQEAQPTISSLDDYLTKYGFVPSTDTLFDGKHLYKFDPDLSAFVENQTIEGLTTTYKHGKFYLICAAPQGELPKYYLVLKDAIYETQYTSEADCPDLRELNQDTTRLWKLLK